MEMLYLPDDIQQITYDKAVSTYYSEVHVR